MKHFIMKYMLLNICFSHVIWNNEIAQTKTNSVIYIIPPNGYQNEKLFDMTDPLYNRDDCMRPFYILRTYLRASGYDLRTTTLSEHENLPNFAGIIVCGIPHDLKTLRRLARLPRNKVIALLLEPPTVVPHYYDRSKHFAFGKIYIMFDDWVDNKTYFKLYYPQTTLDMIKKTIPFNQKKFCTMIAGRKQSTHQLSLYKAREKTIHFFEQQHPAEFDLYGHNWNSVEFPSYKGATISKIETLQHYKFCICYENMRNSQGYITEKIFDVLIAGSIPIYWGAQNVGSYIDTSCFISRDNFESEEKLYSFLTSITEPEYENYIKAAQNYLASAIAYKFSTEYFVTTIANNFVFS